jgi:glycosyltransferase involved in cell wall biosynthesis
MSAPIRIAMVTHDLAIDRRILHEAESLTAAGYEVVIASPEGVRNFPLEREQREDMMGVAPSAPRNGLATVVRLGTRTVRGLGLQPVWFRRLLQRWLGPVEYHYTPLLAPVLRGLQADVFVAHDLPALPATLAAAARSGDALVVYDSHELFPEQGYPPAEAAYWSRLEARSIGGAAAVMTVNRSIAEEMAKRYGIALPAVLRNCTPRQRERPAAGGLHARLGLPPGTQVALFQGRLEAHTRVETLVRAWALLPDVPLHLALVGGGSLSAEMAALVAGLGLEGRVHLHPHVPQAELPAVTAGASVGLIPYQPTCLNNLLCTPNKLFEYLSAEVPVISTDLPEIRRIVAEYGVGVLGPTGTAEEVAALVRRYAAELAGDLTLPARLARTAEELDWDREARVLIEVFERLKSRIT